jgi:hypothetical protein
MMAILSPLRVPAQALSVALAGVGVAWLFLNGHWLISAVAVAVAVVVGIALDALGKAQLPGRPVAAVYLLQGWLLIPLAIAVIASAGAIVTAVELTLPEGTGTETKELVAALSTGIVTFLTAGFISWVGDEKNSQLADHVKDAFEAKYTRPGKTKAGAHEFAAESAGDLWVHAGEVQGIEGWGWDARLKRAHGIEAALKPGA